MFKKDFNCFSAKSITISFSCPVCKTEIEGNLYEIPVPKTDAENDAESRASTDGGFVCLKCKKEFLYEIYCGMYSGGYFQSDEMPENTKLTEN